MLKALPGWGSLSMRVCWEPAQSHKAPRRPWWALALPPSSPSEVYCVVVLPDRWRSHSFASDGVIGFNVWVLNGASAKRRPVSQACVELSMHLLLLLPIRYCVKYEDGAQNNGFFFVVVWQTVLDGKTHESCDFHVFLVKMWQNCWLWSKRFSSRTSDSEKDIGMFHVWETKVVLLQEYIYGKLCPILFGLLGSHPKKVERRF